MKISVVIATRNRSDFLQKTLLSLTRQDFPREDFETQICDHASTDNTAEVSRSFADSLSLNVIKVPYDGFNIPRAKNAGINAARHELVIVLDCGVICPPHFLAAHHKAHEGNDAYVAGPAYGWNNEEEDHFWRSLDPLSCPESWSPSDKIDDCRVRMIPQISKAPWLLYWGCNLSVKTETARRVGGFDETFVGWGWDDVELGFRLEKLGLKFSFEQSAWCLHYPHPRRPLVERMQDATRNWIRAYQKHSVPELELFEASDFEDYENSLHRIENTLRVHEKDIPEIGSYLGNNRSLSDGKILYLGFRDGPTATDVQVVSPVSKCYQDGTIYSFGLRTPFADGEFDYVLMSSYWRFLTFSLAPTRRRVLHSILKEASRVGRKVILADLGLVETETLEILCQEVAELDRESASRFVL